MSMVQDTLPPPQFDVTKRLNFWDETFVEQGETILYKSDESGKPQLGDEEIVSSISRTLPLLPLRGIVVYPMMWVPLPVGLERSLKMVRENLNHPNLMVLATVKDEENRVPGPDEIYSTGIVAHVHRIMERSDSSIRLLVQGLRRIQIREYAQQEPYLRVHAELCPENERSDLTEKERIRSVREQMLTWVNQNPKMPDELAEMVKYIEDAQQWTSAA
ncbi:LON peptidase substrate-binding domain-containing protein [Chloroflexi bacterium TSY]|nr:LON peptidase substrate-binding domain-containing protein [Chloroflexi bacterium TSY]